MSFRWNVSTGMAVGLASLAILIESGAMAQLPGPGQKGGASAPLKSSSELPPPVIEDRAPASAVADLPAPGVPAVEMKNPLPVINLVPIDSKLDEIFALPEWTLAETRTFEATAYALRGRTRTGIHVRRGVIAADPEVLPLGSIVQLSAGKYSGVYTVHDTGGRIKGDVIDLWMPTRREARQFGRQNVRVQVLKMGKTRIKK